MHTEITFQEHWPCPCGSGRSIGQCGCMRRDRLLPPETQVFCPRGPYRNEKCYARELGGCSQTISLEHFVSHAAQKLLAEANGMIHLDGEGIDKRIPASRFGAKVLCTNHNAALSPLDERGVRFFEVLRSLNTIVENLQEAESPRLLCALNGRDVERWLLKILIGMAAGFLARTKKEWEPPLHWLRVLYGKRGMPTKMGLAFRPLGNIVSQNRISLAPLWEKNEPKKLAGMLAVLAGFEFSLILTTLARLGGVYRPSVFRMTSSVTGAHAMAILGWNPPHRVETVDLTWFPGTSRSE